MTNSNHLFFRFFDMKDIFRFEIINFKIFFTIFFFKHTILFNYIFIIYYKVNIFFSKNISYVCLNLLFILLTTYFCNNIYSFVTFKLSYCANNEIYCATVNNSIVLKFIIMLKQHCDNINIKFVLLFIAKI